MVQVNFIRSIESEKGQKGMLKEGKVKEKNKKYILSIHSTL